MKREFTFVFGEGLAADEPLARWIAAIAIAWNDVVFTNFLYVEDSEGGRAVYLARVAAGHLSEALDPAGPFGAGYDDWPEVQQFVESLPGEARDDFHWLRSVSSERSVDGSVAWQLDKMRNHVFHYPHLHAGQSSGRRLEISRLLRQKAKEEGSITLSDGTVGGTRLGFAEEISFAIALKKAGIEADRLSLTRFTAELLESQQRFMRFGETALDRYLRSLPTGVLKEVES